MLDPQRVAVFDLNENDCAHTAREVRLYFEQQGIKAHIMQFTRMQPFAYDFDNSRQTGKPYHMVFIGVDNMPGVETAGNIRDLDSGCPMFLLSETGDYGMEGFRLQALDYIAKPLSHERVSRSVSRIAAK